MQFHLNGFEPGDPEIADPVARVLPSGMAGQCGRTIVVYSARRWTARYTVRFRSEGV